MAPIDQQQHGFVIETDISYWSWRWFCRPGSGSLFPARHDVVYPCRAADEYLPAEITLLNIFTIVASEFTLPRTRRVSLVSKSLKYLTDNNRRKAFQQFVSLRAVGLTPASNSTTSSYTSATETRLKIGRQPGYLLTSAARVNSTAAVYQEFSLSH